MGFSVRSLFLPAVLALVLTPLVASAQAGPGGGAQPPPPGGPPPAGGTAAPAAAAGGGTGGGTGAGAAADGAPKGDARSTGNVGGVSFSDKPVRRAPTGPRVVHRTGPLATFPGFEQLPDGGSRLFVHMSQSVPVEERRAQGSVTYVLRGAHLRVGNDANALVTVHFNTPVFRAKLTPQGNDLLFVLELRSAAAPTFKMSENQDKTSTLQIDFAKGDFTTGDDSLPADVKSPPPPRRGQGRKGSRGAPLPRNGAAPAPAPGAAPPAGGDPGPNP
jgi:hypothetical protein